MQVGLSTAQSAYITPSARALPVQAVRRLEAVSEHDPSTCEHCLAGAVHSFSSGGDEALLSADAHRQAARAPGSDEPPRVPGESAPGQPAPAAGEPAPALSAPPSDGPAPQDEAHASAAPAARHDEPSRPGGLRAAVAPNGQELSESELQLVRELASRDREVRAHEQAHLAAAGGYARGGPTYTYQTGPDGIRYAIGGEVSIDTSPVPGNPRATLAKAQAIMSAANAPAEPSGQDRAVAAAAAQMAARAQAELTQATAIAAYTAGESSASSSVSYFF